MDFNGNGVVIENDFFHTLLRYKLPFTREEIHEFFESESYFKRRGNGTMDYETFKKIFFPKRSGDEADDNEMEEELKFDAKDDDLMKSDIIAKRMMKIEMQIKERFSNNWTSVRKAFLDMDKDYDGFINSEDIATYFGKGDKKLDYRDLRMLIKNRDSKRRGLIDFKDFCRWMGNSIEPSEGFYFRHDSFRNPNYDLNQIKSERNQKNKDKIIESIVNKNLVK